MENSSSDIFLFDLLSLFRNFKFILQYKKRIKTDMNFILKRKYFSHAKMYLKKLNKFYKYIVIPENILLIRCRILNEWKLNG